MKYSRMLAAVLGFGLLITSTSSGSDIGRPDVLELSEPIYGNGLWKIELHVLNDEPLLGLDIPLRFGGPGDSIQLVGVEFKDRVKDWDVKHAAIDNVSKTVIITLISEVGSARVNAGLNLSDSGGTIIADLQFKKAHSYPMSTMPFTTEDPGHALTFFYNRLEGGRPVVEELTPGIETDVVQKASPIVPSSYRLSQNYPNPFNPNTSFVLSLPEESDYSVRIYNVAGQLVKTCEGHSEPGEVTITWGGLNNQGVAVASGVYFYRCEANSFTQTRKMMILK